MGSFRLSRECIPASGHINIHKYVCTHMHIYRPANVGWPAKLSVSEFNGERLRHITETSSPSHDQWPPCGASFETRLSERPACAEGVGAFRLDPFNHWGQK